VRALTLAVKRTASAGRTTRVEAGSIAPGTGNGVGGVGRPGVERVGRSRNPGSAAPVNPGGFTGARTAGSAEH
jgi:hypothetical protein